MERFHDGRSSVSWTIIMNKNDGQEGKGGK